MRRSWLGRAVAAPAVHFLALGALVYAWVPAERPSIVIRADAVEQLRRDRSLDLARDRSRGGQAPSVAGADVVEEAIDEEVLLREAEARGLRRSAVVARRLARIGAFVAGHPEDGEHEAAEKARALGLDRSDVVIRRYLVEMMRLSIAREADHPLPSDAELEAHLRANPDRFGAPEQLRLRHVFVSARRGDGARDVASGLLDDLRGQGAEAGAGLGDPFPTGQRLAGGAQGLRRRLGTEFAAALDDAPTGSWAGPIVSAYGFHLVFVEERTAASLPALSEVRGRVVHHLLRERRAAHLRQRLDALRERYEIRIEFPKPDHPPATQGA